MVRMRGAAMEAGSRHHRGERMKGQGCHLASSERNCPGTDGGDSPGGDFVGIKAQTNKHHACFGPSGGGTERCWWFRGLGLGSGLGFGRLGLVPMILRMIDASEVLVLPS